MEPKTSYRRCGYCRLNWPDRGPDDNPQRYHRCRRCDTPTALQYTSEVSAIMTPKQAQDLINHLNFDAHYADTRGVESEEVYVEEQIAVHQKETFEAIIAEGGFNEEERRRLFHLEQMLPLENTTARFRRYPQPGEDL